VRSPAFGFLEPNQVRRIRPDFLRLVPNRYETRSDCSFAVEGGVRRVSGRTIEIGPGTGTARLHRRPSRRVAASRLCPLLFLAWVSWPDRPRSPGASAAPQFRAGLGAGTTSGVGSTPVRSAEAAVRRRCWRTQLARTQRSFGCGDSLAETSTPTDGGADLGDDHGPAESGRESCRT